MKKVRHIRSW